jgi:S-adenosyl-L-methionine hydrolase (adenosine-forming)
MTPTVAFLSDYGHADEFVGVCEAVIAALAPSVRIIHITHEVAPHDVRAGALALVRSVQYLPDGCIVLAVIDPGVATERRLVAVEVERGVFLGPDNGLLAPAVAMAGGATRVISLTNDEYHLDAPGATFAGRDILAPAAGHLAAGTSCTDLGEVVDAATLAPGLVALPHVDEEGVIEGEVWWVDRFGNCQLNIDPSELAAFGIGPGDDLEVAVGDRVRRARWVRAYGDAKPSELIAVVDSYGLVSLALDRASAAAECGLRAGAAVTVRVGSGGRLDRELHGARDQDEREQDRDHDRGSTPHEPER